MTPSAAHLPVLRSDLLIRPMGADGRHVVKDPVGGTYFTLGPEESFLLLRLDGKADPAALCEAFEGRFGEALSDDDLSDFLEMARDKRLVADREAAWDDDHLFQALRCWPIPGAGPEPWPPPPPPEPAPAKPKRNILFWRVRLFDPKWLFDRLEPRLGLVWTRGFVVAATLLVIAATALAWLERDAFVGQFSHAGWRWIVLAWLALAVTTTCHEFAHGLTCKHFGGEVRDVGFLLLYFMPCFYCNVSDAWLFPERSRRLWVTLAGPACDLVLWSLAVLSWRVAQPGTAVNEFAWMVMSICGVRIFLNLNPLIKLDGYYVLSDALGMHNLLTRGRGRFKAYIRWALWGAARPEAEERGGFLLAYGAASWLFSLFFLTLTISGFALYFGAGWSVVSLGWTVLLGTASAGRLFRDFTKGEVVAMLRSRRGRTAAWLVLAAAASTALAVYPIEDRAAGSFMIRPSARAEVRAPVAGFLREVAADEGGAVAAGGRLARLEVPDLESRLAQKRAELRESEAQLTLLKVGSRPEEVEEQRQRVGRAQAWRDQARRDLDRSRTALQQSLAELEAQITQYRAEVERASEVYQRDRKLLARQALQADQFHETEKALRVANAQLAQAESRQGARRAEGTREAEAELGRRESEASEAEAKLRLLLAGTRPEQLDAERARHARIEEEVRYLEHIQARLTVPSPIDGVITTPRLRERIGQYLQEGDLITEVEAPSRVEAEILVAEHDVARVTRGQTVELKVRALPFRVFRAKVDRIAPAARRADAPAAHGGKAAEPVVPTIARDTPGSFLLYSALDTSASDLKTGMTGYARVLLGPIPLGHYLSRRVLRSIRTEFWW